MITVADLITSASKRQLAQIRQATGLTEEQFSYRNASTLAPWVKREIAAALHRPVDEVFAQSGRQS
jgi:hypothetical protein